MIPLLELRLLGSVQFRLGGKSVAGFRSSKAIALLCYLAVTEAEFARPLLADLLWPDLSEAHANDNLRVTLSNLRSLVGDHLLITRHTVAFNTESPYWLDVRQLQAIGANRGAPLLLEDVKSAVNVYCGDFLAGFQVNDAPAFEQWAAIQHMQLRDLAVRGLHTLIAYTTKLDNTTHALAVEYTQRLLALEPWQEETYQLSMLLLAMGGQPAAAYRQYESCRHILWKESNVEPRAETAMLAQRIRRGELLTEEAVAEILNITARLGTLSMLAH